VITFVDGVNRIWWENSYIDFITLLLYIPSSRRYSPEWALASSTISLHFLLYISVPLSTGG